ncbi:unnamed protein product [Cuscuta epithymum]|uniref:Uncharacterized protein n=1 Tax=Cuscuta epithymum TaxID=186058 RepID=A0AAV0C9M0_9ASTE|nr:unnamed protein product [Cuscuta epithymum]
MLLAMLTTAKMFGLRSARGPDVRGRAGEFRVHILGLVDDSGDSKARLLGKSLSPYLIHKIPRPRGSSFCLMAIQVFASFNLLLAILNFRCPYIF